MSSRPSCSIPHNPRRIGRRRLARPSFSAFELVIEPVAQDRIRLDPLQNLALPRLRKVVLGQAERRRHCPYQARTRRLVILSPQRTRKVRRTELDLRRERSERETALSKDVRELFGEWTVRAAGIALALAKRTGGARSRRRLPLTHAQKGAMTGARLPPGPSAPRSRQLLIRASGTSSTEGSASSARGSPGSSTLLSPERNLRWARSSSSRILLKDDRERAGAADRCLRAKVSE